MYAQEKPVYVGFSPLQGFRHPPRVLEWTPCAQEGTTVHILALSSVKPLWFAALCFSLACFLVGFLAHTPVGQDDFLFSLRCLYVITPLKLSQNLLFLLTLSPSTVCPSQEGIFFSSRSGFGSALLYTYLAQSLGIKLLGGQGLRAFSAFVSHLPVYNCQSTLHIVITANI